MKMDIIGLILAETGIVLAVIGFIIILLSRR